MATGGTPHQQGEQRRQAAQQPPAVHGLARTRWRLQDFGRVCAYFAQYSAAGISKALRRLGVSRQRGRRHLHSPDPHYRAKAVRLEQVLLRMWEQPAAVRVLFADEASYYRQPDLAPQYAPVGQAPVVPLSHRSNTCWRLCAGLDALSGATILREGSKIGVPVLCAWLRQVRAAYPDHDLYVVWDNWPVHAHPKVLEQARALDITIIWLPTYAPWLNPIEKLWRWLRQTVLHAHARTDHWEDLKHAVRTFLAQFAHGSRSLLRYVGLLPD